MDQFLNMFRDLPGFLDSFIQNHGLWVYALLFAIVFCETGLVVTPFLPGDSLLFTVGAVAARGSMNVWVAAGILFTAAILGNTSNYWIGRFLGPKVFSKEGSGSLLERMLSKKHLARAHQFYEKYGGKAVILGQFVPIVRTFCPFVAGAGAMNFPRFIAFNLLGATLWIGICTGAGWYFGNIDWVKRHFEAVILGVIVISLIPLAVEVWIQKRK
jgi:membrane-associated protein